ncbi:MAG: DNA mismatch repair endonuclease MutL [Bacteroidales bacterium]|nr:DNA mismatch repair endonuclease MutL [Bacteroidales bacterium]
MTAPDIIHLLPDSVANQIAAGEVIQRPASVVKELVENSIDAGATQIKIIIKDAGRTLIQVIDDGCGMSVTDARMAFERHATSKIQQATDLFSLHTMGFRGEALPSIAAVSEIELRTKRAEDVAGTRLIISASQVESQQPDVCAKGSNIMVKRLFFNLPARRKFLKKDPVELGHISREFERLALVNTNVEFSFISNDVTIHQLPPAPLKKRICDLFSKTLDHQIIPIATDTSLVKIDGFVSLPSSARRRGALQYFFVNGRNMRHPYFHKAVISCYEDLIPADAQPCYFINFEVDPATIDVNIHPQKHEIKFENEQPIWQILSAAIKESLGRFNARAALDFDAVDAPDIPAFQPDDAATLDTDIDLRFNPFKLPKPPSSPDGSFSSRPYRERQAPSDWEKLYQNFTSRGPAIDTEEQPADIENIPMVRPSALNAHLPMAVEAEAPSLFQLKGRYIVSPARSGLMLIDQHRAHVRVLYEKYVAMSQQGPIPSQRLIFPDTVDLDATQAIVAASVAPTLASMGFDLCRVGSSNSWAINAVPSILGSSSPAEALLNVINALSDADEDVEQSQWHRIALSVARSASIKYGAALTPSEMDSLVADLFHLPIPDYTPDGKPIIKLIDLDYINKMF